MDTLAYCTGESGAIPCKSVYPLSKTSATQYSKDNRPVVTECRKLLCMNVKQPNAIRLLSRQGKYTDTMLKVESIRHLSSTESHSSHPLLFFAVGGKEFAILSPQILATGELSVSVKESLFDEELYAATTGDTGKVFVLGQNNFFEVNESTGEPLRSINLTPKTVVKYPTFDYHRKYNLIVVPAKNTHLDLISSQTHKSVLSKAWEPHTDAVPIFARFFHVHAFEEEKNSKPIFMLTTACNNSELRFWSFNTETQRFNLKQEITIIDKDDKSTPQKGEFEISITPNEEYIILASRQYAFAVVIELHRTLFKVHRMTTWKMQGPALCCATSIGKIAESSQSKSVSYELFVTLRTQEGFYQAMLDSNKLMGASNMSSSAGIDKNPVVDSISVWFGKSSSTGPTDKFNEVSNRAGGNTQLTAVSSSLLGDSKIANTISEASAAKVVRQQAAKFCEQLLQFDTEFANAQKSASDNLRMFQDSRFREEAQSIGRRFAARNQGRLQWTPSSRAAGSPDQRVEPGMMTEQQQELLQSISNFVKEIEGGSAAATSAALKALMQKQLKSSVDKALLNLDHLDVAGTSNPNISSTGAAKQFRADVEAASRQMLATVRGLHAQMKTVLETSHNETQSMIQRARGLAASIHKGLTDLKHELAEAKASLATLQSPARTAPVDPDTLVARVVSQAEAGDWAGALTLVLESGDLLALLKFLESNVCQENISVLTSPNTLTLPLFLSLCLQLTYELNSDPSSILLRINMLHHFYVNWDDSLKNMKEQAAKDVRHAKAFELTKRELRAVQGYLGAIDIMTLDRKSKNKCRLVKKLIDDILEN
ncbi:unnamed protein product [Phytomonas sp. EM1]|nr:unnamed protein product [Phytomonas sp. EM1]|eukprot:CCW61818.1 unnamed protein product [Phytomonas sp. isolate EM1]